MAHPVIERARAIIAEVDLKRASRELGDLQYAPQSDLMIRSQPVETEDAGLRWRRQNAEREIERSAERERDSITDRTIAAQHQMILALRSDVVDGLRAVRKLASA